LIVCKYIEDNRLGGVPRYYLTAEDVNLMQVPDEIRKSVGFICFRESGDSDSLKLAGTAFFVVVNDQEVNCSFGYIVTAKHVIVGIQRSSADGKVFIRVNKTDGSFGMVQSRISDWNFHPEDPSVDVAVLAALLPQDTFDYRPIPIEMAVTKNIIQNEAIGVGDEVFLTGLFVNHFGQKKNLPIVRTGNIALMPEEPVNVKELGPIDAVLVEARSIGGLSGSPVFVYTGAMRIIGNSNRMGGGNRFYWLGLMHGHWDMEVSEDDTMVEDSFTKDRVNMGIAIVIPVAKILELINQEAFVKSREEEIQRRRELTLPTPDAITTDTE